MYECSPVSGLPIEFDTRTNSTLKSRIGSWAAGRLEEATIPSKRKAPSDEKCPALWQLQLKYQNTSWWITISSDASVRNCWNMHFVASIRKFRHTNLPLGYFMAIR